MKNTMRKMTAIVALIIAAALALAGCAKISDTNSSNTPEPIVFGLMPSEDAIPLQIAMANGYFDDLGVDVTFQVFKSAKDRNAAFQSGELDGIIGDQTAIVLYQSGGFDVKIASYTNCDFSFIASAASGITDWKDLEGKSVAISELTVIEYALDNMLQEKNIAGGSIVKTAIPAIPARVEMLGNGQVDSALLPEPFASLALANDGVLLGKASDLDLRITVIAFSADAIDKKRASIDKFLEAYDRGVDYANETPVSEYEGLFIESMGFPETMAGKIKLPEYDRHGLPGTDELNEVIAWVAAKGVDTKELKAEDLVMK